MRVEIERLRKHFGSTAVLRDLTLTVPSGGRVALVGPNGSGKSTLLRALVGLIRCDGGEVRLDGRSPLEDRGALARRIAYVPQAAPQLGVPVREVVAAVASLRGLAPARIAAVARELDLHLSDVSDRRFRDLSGGMKQKLLIALALAADAELLVMDEPTASLDGPGRARFFRLFGERSAGATLVLSSHRLEDVRHLVDDVAQLAEGRVVAAEPADAFLDERALSVLELHVDGNAPAEWLAARGFRLVRHGWWRGTVSQRRKMVVLAELQGTLGASARDLQVRDLESLEPGAPVPGDDETSDARAKN